MEGTLRCTLGSHAQHAHSLEDHTRSIQQSTSTHTSIIYSDKIATTPKHIANCFTKQFTNRYTNRYTNRATHKIQGYNITLTVTQVQEAIKQFKHQASKTHGPSWTRISHEHVEKCS